jgi:hypothetical protein
VRSFLIARDEQGNAEEVSVPRRPVKPFEFVNDVRAHPHVVIDPLRRILV